MRVLCWETTYVTTVAYSSCLFVLCYFSKCSPKALKWSCHNYKSSLYLGTVDNTMLFVYFSFFWRVYLKLWLQIGKYELLLLSFGIEQHIFIIAGDLQWLQRSEKHRKVKWKLRLFIELSFTSFTAFTFNKILRERIVSQRLGKEYGLMIFCKKFPNPVLVKTN